MPRFPILLTLLTLGCAGTSRQAAEPLLVEDPRPPQLVVIGLDGATWNIAEPLMHRGLLPNLEAIVSEGVRAPLKSMDPMFSPRLWTTMSTGRRPEDHGVQSFVDFIPGTGRIAELVLYDLPSGTGRLEIRLISPEPQTLRLLLDGEVILDTELEKGWQLVATDLPAGRSNDRPVLTLQHGKRWTTGETRPLIGGGREELARTAGYDLVRFVPSEGEPVLWDLGDYQSCGDWLKSGFFIDRNEAEDGTDFLWAGQLTRIPVSRAHRRVPAVWNILGDAGFSVGVIGHWATWPAEEVRGFLISDRVIYTNFNHDDSAVDDTRGQTYPPELVGKLLPSMVSPDEVPAELLTSFGVDELGFRHAWARPAKVRAALGSTLNYGGWARHLLPAEDPDYFYVYFDAIDVMSHIDYGPAFDEGNLRSDSSLARIYRLLDARIGELRSLARPGHRVLVLSDHGFEPYPEDELQKIPTDLRVANTGRHAMEGVLAAAGPGLARGRVLTDADLLDITPTILAMFGLPAAQDMQGRVLDLWSEPPDLPARVPSFGSSPPLSPEENATDDALEQHLRSLGYIE